MKERLANSAIIGEKHLEQDFNSEVGMKSSGEDFDGVVRRSWSTSRSDTGEKVVRMMDGDGEGGIGREM